MDCKAARRVDLKDQIFERAARAVDMLSEPAKMAVSFVVHSARDLDGACNVHQRSFYRVDFQAAGEIFEVRPDIHLLLPPQA